MFTSRSVLRIAAAAAGAALIAGIIFVTSQGSGTAAVALQTLAGGTQTTVNASILIEQVG